MIRFTTLSQEWRKLGGLASVACLLIGCAGVPPQQLRTARAAVNDAKASTPAQLAPVELDNAKQALARAELAFEDGEEEQIIKDLAYIAERKVAISISAANLEAAKRSAKQSGRDRDDARDAAYASAKQQLGKTQDALAEQQRKAERDADEAKRLAAEEKRRLEAAKKKGKAEVARVKKQLEKEQLARIAAEKKAAAAMASLAQIAKVKEEKRGVVITLSGSVLFATGQHKLLPIANSRLDSVAKALKDQGFTKIIVEGHTDSRGAPSTNEALSLNRAQGVRQHLISRGILKAKITAVGHGPRRPIAENKTTEGRANNRRVEIVVK